MNVLIIYPNGNLLNPHSGAETRFWNSVCSLTNLNYKVTILHSEKSIGFEDKDLKKKCSVFYNKNLSLFGLSDFYLTDFNPFFILKLIQLRKLKFDIVQYEFPWGFFVTKLLTKKKSFLVYDSQGIESDFIKIAVKHPMFPKFFKPFAKVFGILYEKLVCKLADVIVNVSEIDRNYYIKKHKISRSKTILIQTPSALNHQNIMRTDSLRIKHRKKLGLPLEKTIVIFHGGLPHPPNQQAFDLIENYISPNIKNPNILFVLAGHNVREFKKNNIVSLGFVKDLRDLLYAADFAIVPLLDGSGMRIKCTDYIITALPFITTKKGIEGIDFVKPEDDYLLYDSVDDKFLEGIVELHKNKELREKLHLNLLKKSNVHNREKFEYKFSKLYSRLVNKK